MPGAPVCCSNGAQCARALVAIFNLLQAAAVVESGRKTILLAARANLRNGVHDIGEKRLPIASPICS